MAGRIGLVQEKEIEGVCRDLKFNWSRAFYWEKVVGFYIPFRLIGLLSWRIEYNVIFHISKIEVLSSLDRGQGYGKEFLSEIERFAKQLGCNCVEAWCEGPIRGFYVKCGYEESVAEDVVGGEHIILMRKKI